MRQAINIVNVVYQLLAKLIKSYIKIDLTYSKLILLYVKNYYNFEKPFIFQQTKIQQNIYQKFNWSTI